jgi:antitoxin component of MazEF toxin-antitoxin module
MSNYTATIIKTGNSYALRVPKEYISLKHLKLGQKVRLLDDPAIKEFDQVAFTKALQELQALKPFKSIKDPAAWQREIRKNRPLPGRE